jgi:hypothetical protein
LKENQPIELLKNVLFGLKSIRFSYIKGFNILDFKKHHFKINKTQS